MKKTKLEKLEEKLKSLEDDLEFLKSIEVDDNPIGVANRKKRIKERSREIRNIKMQILIIKRRAN